LKTEQRIPERKVDGRAWARKILARHDAGYQLPRISVEMAREALGLEVRDREPGEDDQ
jgi:hypothetical protein